MKPFGRKPPRLVAFNRTRSVVLLLFQLITHGTRLALTRAGRWKKMKKIIGTLLLAGSSLFAGPRFGFGFGVAPIVPAPYVAPYAAPYGGPYVDPYSYGYGYGYPGYWGGAYYGGGWGHGGYYGGGYGHGYYRGGGGYHGGGSGYRGGGGFHGGGGSHGRR